MTSKYYQISNDIRDAQSYLYVKRDADAKLYSACQQLPPDQVVSILGPRQLGKSSLVHQLTQKLSAHYRVIFLDFRQVFSSEQLIAYKSNLPIWELQPKFADALLMAIAFELDYHTWFMQWQAEFHSLAKQSPLSYLQTGLAALVKHHQEDIKASTKAKPLLIACDEWDKLASLGIYAELIYVALEKWLHTLPVRWIVVSNTAPLDLLKNYPKSKFGFFNKHHLDDFNWQDKLTVQAWAEPLSVSFTTLANQPNTSALQFAEQALQLTGGQPLLTAVLLSNVQLNPALSLDDFIQLAYRLTEPNQNSDMSGHFAYAGEILADIPSEGFAALTLYQKLLEHTLANNSSFTLPYPVSDSDFHNAQVLRRAGMVKLQQQNSLYIQLRSPLHTHVYNAEWIANQSKQLLKNLPQKTAQLNTSEQAKRILVINVGGTMGMEVREDGRVTVPQNESRFFNQFAGISSFAEIVPLSYKPTDGANIGIEHWQNIAQLIHHQLTSSDIDNNHYAGIVIIHGTDTLAYTASAVAFALGPHLPVPVVFTGAQSPNNVAHGDSSPNFLRACRVAADGKLKEVVVVFNDRILRAVRTEKKHDYLFDGFHSPSFVELGKIGESLQYTPLLPLAAQTNYHFENRSQQPLALQNWRLRNQYCSNILHISQAPGVNPNFWLNMVQTKALDGVFIESLGVFNIPIEGEGSYEPIIETAVKRNIPVLVSSRYPIQPEFRANYAPAQKAEQLGGMIAGNMTVAAALTKFMWGLAQVKHYAHSANRHSNLKQLLINSYIGEIDVAHEPLKENHYDS